MDASVKNGVFLFSVLLVFANRKELIESGCIIGALTYHCVTGFLFYGLPNIFENWIDPVD